MNPDPKQEGLLTIGELSRLTGISTYTLRMWEKRYGMPRNRRLPSGHRRYPREEVPRLRAIAKALERGFRAGKVVCGTLDELQNLLGLRAPLTQAEPAGGEEGLAVRASGPVQIEKWIEAVHRFDEATLTQEFYEAWGKNGPMEFVLHLAAPFVNQVGLAWETGELTVSQEHFASERLEHFLSAQWRRMNERKTGPAVLLTTLPGDSHRLGLAMCAVVTALTERKIVYLGPDTPTGDIVSAVQRCGAELLCLSISSSADPVEVDRSLKALRKALPRRVTLAVGGAGAPDTIAGVTRFDSFSDYFDWLTAAAD